MNDGRFKYLYKRREQGGEYREVTPHGVVTQRKLGVPGRTTWEFFEQPNTAINR
jgi:hypothetical protein